MKLTQEKLKQVLSYDPETGEFVWLKVKTNRVRVGSVAGTMTGGYRQIRVGFSIYKSHRLAWLYVYGVWPKNHIDHINGIKLDNRIANLRDATNTENGQNIRRAHCDSKSGLLGASWDKARRLWVAQICTDGKRRTIGSYRTAQEAHEAYVRAKREDHRTCTL